LKTGAAPQEHMEAEPKEQKQEDVKPGATQQELTLHDCSLTPTEERACGTPRADAPEQVSSLHVRPEEVISSHGHQMLTLNDSAICQQQGMLPVDYQSTEDITEGLSEVPPIWEEDITDWFDIYSEDCMAELETVDDNTTALDNMYMDFRMDRQMHPMGPEAFDDMHMEWMANNSMQLAALRDNVDWQFDPDLFMSYNLRCGPFQVDACADNDGRNAQCAEFWCSKDSYASHSWAGLNVWCNPPFEKVAALLCHATRCHYESPEDTRALLVLPDWPDARWWPNIVDSSICQCVGYYPAGTHLFTTPATGRGQRKVMGPTRWRVIMLLLGKPAVAGVCIPWGPWPPT